MAVNPLLASRPANGSSTGSASASQQKSVGPSKRVVDYGSSSDDDDEGEDFNTQVSHRISGPRQAASSNKQNGIGKRRSDEQLFKSNAVKRAKQNGMIQEEDEQVGSGSTGNGPTKGKGKAKEDERLRVEAERLFETRKELPFYQGRRAILEEILANDTTIILGETGCGKSTQLPQLLRRHPLSLASFTSSSSSSSSSAPSRGPRIGVTQPRRLPAIALATRVAAEMGSRVGDEVGYTVRFEDCSDVYRTGVRYLTEGVLMRELANGGSHADTVDGLNLLLRYDVLVIDEAHERTLNTDFLCGALKKVQRIRKRLHEEGMTVEQLRTATARPKANGQGPKANGSSNTPNQGRAITPLKLVIMSATLDPSKFVTFFETPALMVKGRMYDVATQHLTAPVDDYVEAAAKQVMTIHMSPNSVVDGDVLVFMPGAEEIEMCADILRRAMKELEHLKGGANGRTGHKAQEILPLYAQLPPSAQAAIFKPRQAGTRRVVIATNIAETSMTIPGVSYVVDTGFKKEKEYIYRTSGAIEHLKVKNVSKAAAWQRTGRAGRERAGHCYRLFTQTAFDGMINFDAPEIQRCNLSSAVLQLIAMGQNPFEFEYIDNPGKEPILAAFQTLAGLEAITGPESITPLGRQMLLYPLDPGHARILISSLAPQNSCVSEIIDILSLLDAGPVWVDKQNEREASAAAKAKFVSRDGDHLTGMNVLRAFMELKEANAEGGKGGSQGQGVGAGAGVGKWAKESFVNLKTLNSALKVRQQLRELVKRHGHDPDLSAGQDTDKVRRCLLAGMFMNTAVIQSDGTYRQAAGSLTVKIHPSSILMSKKVPAIMYDELTITSAMYARNVSTFDQSWLLEIPWFRSAMAGARPILS